MTMGPWTILRDTPMALMLPAAPGHRIDTQPRIRRLPAVFTISEYFKFMLHDLKFIGRVRHRHRAKADRIRLLALQADHVMMVVVFAAAGFEFDSVLKHDLFENAKLLHDPQI